MTTSQPKLDNIKPVLDLTKPLETEDGRKVRIICKDRNLEGAGLSIIGLITQPNGYEQVRNYKLDGTPIYGWSRDTLVNLKKKLYLLVWMNCHNTKHTIASYESDKDRTEAIAVCRRQGWKVNKTFEVELDF